MATYHGSPFEAGIGPTDGDIVLFAACPPPEDLGFEPATGHWRKQLRFSDVQAVWESRPIGKFRGERCMVLDDLGDRLHIGYLGHDGYKAEQLGYWQVDRGVFELVAPRSEVSDILEERAEYGRPASSTDGAGRLRPVPEPSAYAGQERRGSREYPPAQPRFCRASRRLGRTTRPDTRSPHPTTPPDTRSQQATTPPVIPCRSRRPRWPATPRLPASLIHPATCRRLRNYRSSARLIALFPTGLPASHSRSRLRHRCRLRPRRCGRHRPRGGRVGRQQRRRRRTRRVPRLHHPGSAARPAAGWRPSACSPTSRASPASLRMPTQSARTSREPCAWSRADERFEVYHSSGGAQHELQVFPTEESACFYLFGVLAAEAVRNGTLGRVPTDVHASPAY